MVSQSQRMLCFLYLLAILICKSIAKPEYQYQYAYCFTFGSYAPNSTYQTNLHALLSTLTSNTQINYGFYNISYGQDSDQVYATGLCRGDIPIDTCRTCLNDIGSFVLKQCPNQKEAMGFYDKCTLHYSYRSIFGYDSHEYAFEVYYAPIETNVTNWDQYNHVLTNLLQRLKVKAATNDSHPNRKFAAGKAAVAGVLQTIYAVVQCSPDVTVAECNDCLNGAISGIPKHCDQKLDCALIKISCNIRYQNSSFYEPTADELTLQLQLSPPQGSPPLIPSATTNSSHATHHGNNNSAVIAVVVSTVAFVGLLIFICIYFIVRKPTKHIESEAKVVNENKQDSSQLDFDTIRVATNNFSNANKLGQGGFGPVYKGWLFNEQEIAVKRLSGTSSQGDIEFKNEVLLMARLKHRNLVSMSEAKVVNENKQDSSQLDFDTIRVATNNFSNANKLGQGGFGPVYKGWLFNEQEIAVKRLSGTSSQGDIEFKNEVLLMARLKHRNLVTLLGFCFERNERLLVYEFLPNKSLDNFLYDRTKRALLNWKTRYKIIEGIARGLLYLHEDSQQMIIHRDLKASNILLDAEMNPKISDFGLAKLFVVDQTQAVASKIAGTRGYMAPEYARHGKFSVKSDVFSFGVIILEIVSGQKNCEFLDRENVKHLISFAWNNWRKGTISNIIDPTLNDALRNEIERCIQIGLLCVQERVADRPTMASVVLMLDSCSFSLPAPLQPAFFMKDICSPDIQYSECSSVAIGSNEQKTNSAEASVNEASISSLCPR